VNCAAAMDCAIERPGWTTGVSSSRGLVCYTHIATNIQVWSTEGENRFFQVDNIHAKASATISLACTHSPVDMRASPLTVVPSITREEKNSMHKRKAPVEEVTPERQLAVGSSQRWVRASQEFSAQKKSLVAEMPIVVDGDAPTNTTGKHSKPPLHNAINDTPVSELQEGA